MPTQKNKYKITFCIWVIIIALHCTDIKVSVIKITEIFFLLYALFRIRSLCKENRFFFLFFTGFLIITFIHNLFLNFDTSVADTFLRMPYWCSLGRYFEIVSCLAFVEYTIKIIKKRGFDNVINSILKGNFYFSVLILLLYILQLSGISIYEVSYKEGRLRGFFVEGGPFGLLCAIMSLLSIINRRPRIETALLVVLVLLARSKAGICCLSAYIGVNYVIKLYNNRQYRKYIYIGAVMIFILFVYVFTKIASMYIDSIKDVEALELYVTNNPTDYSAVAGRISGTFIVYEMFIKNPFFGIGIGNYPILRNLPEYRTFFPKIDVYDASGYGGLVDILNQCGLVGFTIFLVFLYRQFYSRKNYIYIILFIMPMAFGVQYTFMYPWLMMALYSCCAKPKKINVPKQVDSKDIIR